MKLKVGDRVKFLNDIGLGEVVSIIDKNTAMVLNEDDFEVPVLINDLILDSRYITEETDHITPDISPKPVVENIITEEIIQLDDEEIVLAFVPEENSSAFESYLINSSSYNLKYVISNEKEGEQILYHQGELEAGIKVLLRNYHPGQLKDEENFRIQIIFYNQSLFNHMAPVDMLIKFQASEMYDASKRVENDYFHEKAIVFTLFDWKQSKESKMEIDVEELRKAMYTKGDLKKSEHSALKSRRSKEALPEDPEEVDLHIETLVDNHGNMDNGQILDIQISRFRTAMATAILHRTDRVVFIHGVGNGKLKFELRKILDADYKKVKYQDASFKEYGYGATMVLI